MKDVKELFWMKESAINQLNSDICNNLHRYREGDFSDLAESEDWKQKSLLEYEATDFKNLSGDSSQDTEDALIIFNVLKCLEPRLATAMNIWVRLAHTELLPYARKRWLKIDGDDQQLKKSIETHFFAGGITGYRDDNACGRPWWTGYIGSMLAASTEKDDIRRILLPLTRTTDTRQNFIERSGIFSEKVLGKAISQYLSEGRLPESNKESTFRAFMVTVNLKSNGRYFGDMSTEEIYSFLDTCL